MFLQRPQKLHHPLMISILSFIVLFVTTFPLSNQFTTSVSGSFPSATVILEGCLDDGCLQHLSNQQNIVSKCFDPLREQLSPDIPDYSINLCCNFAKFERCLFPFIISFCGMDSLDKFDHELKSLNSMCSMTTLQWNKCEVNKTEPEIDPELRE